MLLKLHNAVLLSVRVHLVCVISHYSVWCFTVHGYRVGCCTDSGSYLANDFVPCIDLTLFTLNFHQRPSRPSLAISVEFYVLTRERFLLNFFFPFDVDECKMCVGRENRTSYLRDSIFDMVHFRLDYQGGGWHGLLSWMPKIYT